MNLAPFLRTLFEEGRIVVGLTPPVWGDDPEAQRVLERAQQIATLELGGPTLPFAADTALRAARVLYRAAWFLVCHDEPAKELKQHLTLAPAPLSAEHHLAADLSLRYLPAVYRRARALDPGDALPHLLVEVLRTWPLSGVLADLCDEPKVSPDFGGHPGLSMLYAERLAKHDKPAWLPADRSYVELVKQEAC